MMSGKPNAVMGRTGGLAGAAVALLLAAPGVQAALVQLCGPSVCYEYDDNVGVNAGIAYYGTPVLLGNSDTLKFNPLTFAVDSDPGTVGIPGPTLTAVFAFTRVWSPQGLEIASISVAESGDYQVQGDATVAANLRVQVVDLVDDGLPGPGFPEVLVDNQVFSSSTPTGLPMAGWSLNSVVSPAAVFQDLATSIDLSIQNTLQAFEGPGGGYSFIAKKLVLTVGTTAMIVPVPAAAWLLGSAFGVLILLRRR